SCPRPAASTRPSAPRAPSRSRLSPSLGPVRCSSHPAGKYGGRRARRGSRGQATKLPRMAEPARNTPPDVPVYDPGVVRREYRRQRARREARLRRTRERRAANVRFWLIVLALLALSVYLSIAMWHQVQRLFGL